MSSIQILGPLVPSLPLQVLPEEKQYAVEGAPTLKTSSRRRRRWKISLSLSSPVSRSFFSILSRIFPRKLKSCLFLSFNNSWGLGRGSGGQGCELDLCELLFLRAREREEERVYVMWVPALSGRGWGFSGRCRGQSSREAKLEAIIRCPHGCPWIMLRETGLRELGN